MSMNSDPLYRAELAMRAYEIRNAAMHRAGQDLARRALTHQTGAAEAAKSVHVPSAANAAERLALAGFEGRMIAQEAFAADVVVPDVVDLVQPQRPAGEADSAA